MDNQGGIVIYHHHARKAKAKAMRLLLCDYYTLDIQGTVKHSLRGKQS